MKTWKVLSWNKEPDGKIELSCPYCGNEAFLPTHGNSGALIIAATGLNLIFDPPGHTPPKDWMPEIIECRKCHRIFDGGENVR